MARKGIDVMTTLMVMPKIEWRYTVVSKEQRVQRRSDYHLNIRKQFAKHISHKYPEKLRAMGIPEEQIQIMQTRGEGPEGFNIHHKIPIHAGGTNDFSNLALMRLDLHCGLHHYLDRQIIGMQAGDSRLVYLPYVEGEIFDVAPWQEEGWCPDAPEPVPPAQSFG